MTAETRRQSVAFSNLSGEHLSQATSVFAAVRTSADDPGNATSIDFGVTNEFE